MKIRNTTQLAVAISLIFFCLPSWSSNQLHPEVMSVAKEWANITYRSDSKERRSALSALQNRAESLLLDSPNDENLLTWSGIVTASHAGEVGGLKALKIVKKAKSYFEKAMNINPDALNGGARTSLGALYYQVPGWPIAFGSNKKAQLYLTESANRFPKDINAQYFLADFMLDQKRYDEAISIFENALQLEPREAFHVADTGRLLEIRSKLSTIQSKK